MSRFIALDTETTGLEVEDDHRIIEVACVEVIDRATIGKTYRQLINPQREVETSARNVHGFQLSDLLDKPLFHEMVDDFLAFIGDSTLVIQNSKFDLSFLNNELGMCSRQPLQNEVYDTLIAARKRWPGQRNSLDALCKRFSVDNSNRVLHGALIDADLLARVFIEMTNEREPLLNLGENADKDEGTQALSALNKREARPLMKPTRSENARHKTFVDNKISDSYWNFTR